MKGPRLGLAAGLAGALGCASRPPQPPSAPAYDGPLYSPEERADDFFDRQKIVATYRDRAASFDAVLQKRGDELTLLGLTPFGSRAFVVRQKGAEISFQTFVDEPLPFPPSYMLIDVHRVFFQAFAAKEAPPRDGERTAVRQGEVVTEKWQEGRLRQRTFSRADGRLPGRIVVEYEGGMPADGTPPAHIAFTNGWYGYRLDITTVAHKPL
jgi:hypothetical protein